MGDKTHIGFINAHAKRYRRNHNLNIISLEILLDTFA